MNYIKNFAIVAGLSACLFSGAAHASTVSIVNGSFEQPGTFSGSFQTLSAGSNGITGWTVGAGGVDHIRTYWQSSEGSYSLDLNAGSAGSISQSVNDLQVGGTYLISFDMAANVDRGSRIKTLVAAIDGVGESFDFDGTGHSRTAMGWEQRSFEFIATDISAVLSFTGTEPAAWGAALDNISIVQTAFVPLPGGLLLFGTALGALGIARSRRS